MAWTIEQILALAPDAASAKAGQALATPHKWSGFGTHEHAVWGRRGLLLIGRGI